MCDLNKKIGILTYNVPHRKTYDTLCLLKAKGYQNVRVFGQPMTYEKKRQPLIKHRPEMNIGIPDSQSLCRNFGYEYCEGKFEDIISDKDSPGVFLLCGAGLLGESFVNAHRIINAHPGYIPYARGLDALKWSIWYKLPVGVSTHYLGKYIDAGEIIEIRSINVDQYDSFHSVAQRVYENEIDMLVGAIEKENEKHEYIIPPEDSRVFKRMPEDKELLLFERFEEYKSINITV